MDFKQYYLGCLAHASYLIGAEGEAAVVDPQRDVDLYLADAEALGLAIRHVLLTHLHADFVAGHCELARRTGARIWISERAGAEFEHVPVHDGDELFLGPSKQVVLRFLATPGHTPESMTVLVTDRTVSDAPQKALTGDTLFIGGVGRPDLVGAQGLSPEEMAGMLYDSLREKILPLPDDLVVYPAHGAGSACGKGMSEERFATLGDQKRNNVALQPMTREAFVEQAVTGLGRPPAYFFHDAVANRRGAAGLDELEPPRPLGPAEAREALEAGATALDVRSNVEWGAGHVPGSVNVGLGGQFASWCGTLFAPDAPLVIVAANDAQVAEARMRLARVGLENVVGALAGGVDAWRAASLEMGLEVGTVAQVEPADLARALESEADLVVLDVRRPAEFEGGHVPGAVHVPLDELADRLDEVDRTRPTAVICAGGYRSSAACGLLAAAGHRQLRNVLGGTSAWVRAGLPVEVPEGAAS